jgi:hypothetical protein
MISVIDLHVANEAHVIVNSSLLTMWRELNPKEKIVMFAEKNHLVNLKAYYKQADLKYQEKPFYSSGNRFKIFLKEFLEIINLIYISRKVKGSKKVIITSVLPLTHLFFKIFRTWLFGRIPVVVTLHGELEFLKNKEKLNLMLFGYFLRKALGIKNDNTYYLVLGKVIRDNLLKLIPMDGKKVISIDHPFPYTFCSEKYEPNDEQLKMGTIGVASAHKNTHYIFQLGQDFQKEIADRKFTLSIVGKLDHSMHSYTNNHVVFMQSQDLLSRNEFEKKIKTLDYALFFYDNRYYQLCSSGAIFDAFQYEKPIIAMKNDFFEYYFNRFGNIGYLCNSYDEIKNKIREIIQVFPSEEYNLQVANLRRAKEELSIKKLTQQIELELQRVQL